MIVVKIVMAMNQKEIMGDMTIAMIKYIEARTKVEIEGIVGFIIFLLYPSLNNNRIPKFALIGNDNVKESSRIML